MKLNNQLPITWYIKDAKAPNRKERRRAKAHFRKLLSAQKIESKNK